MSMLDAFFSKGGGGFRGAKWYAPPLLCAGGRGFPEGVPGSVLTCDAVSVWCGRGAARRC
jgi:hypothetical protein